MSSDPNETLPDLEDISELTRKYSSLQQSAQILALEKQEYLNELQELKSTTTELAQRNQFLERLSQDTQQQASLLSRQYRSYTTTAHNESDRNKKLTDLLNQHIQTINLLTQENESLTKTNQTLESKLEAANDKYCKLEILSRNQLLSIEQYELKLQAYNTRIQEQLHEIGTLQQKIAFSTTPSHDEDVKSNEQSPPNDSVHVIPHHPTHFNQPTMELKLHNLYSGAATPTFRSHSNSVTSNQSNATPSLRDRHTFHFGSSNNTPSFAPHAHSVRRQSSTLNLSNFPLMAIRQSESYDALSKLHQGQTMRSDDFDAQSVTADIIYTDQGFHFEDDLYGIGSTAGSPNAASMRFSMLSNKDAFPNTSIRSTGSDDSLGDLKEIQRLQDLLHAQEKEFGEALRRKEEEYEQEMKGLKDMNEAMKSQLGEKDKIIKMCTKQVYELNEGYKVQKKRWFDNWEKEKKEMIKKFKTERNEINGRYRKERDVLMETYDERMEEMKQMEERCKGFEYELKQRNKQIKRLQKRNQELEMIVTNPPQNESCYSVTKWFKFS